MKTTHIDFVGRRRQWAAISAVLILISILSLAFNGLNLSIDFVGGTSFLLQDVNPDTTSQTLSEAAVAAGASDVVAQVKVSGDVAIGATVRTAALEVGGTDARAVQDALVQASGAKTSEVSFVGPSWGQRISRKALEALVVFLIVVIGYISLRLEFKMAVAAVIALVHDIFITIGLYSLAGFNVSPSTVIALLTILGYSLYDTVVVFDRVKETSGALGQPGRRTVSQSINTSMNEVLWRSLNTSLTSLLPVGSLLVLGSQLLGANTLADLALALFIGMALGAYSSIFIAGPFLAWWKESEPEYARLRERVEAAGSDGELDPAQEAAYAGTPVTSEYVRGRGKRKRGSRR